ncbi:hypothetical protein A3C37_00910 [Candidatus Peribacteria bacterium RIFCSPHIGHO2_02_FULL_53_20]|nr:MAG: hypothetical protein A3C37_00910 [Candidatus Peribacteria bacterium RIFCSPHIGHO2_02_FULL_53_20]OGJ71486.1 MAG: hypothetical protein A3G69_02385 [Candidatus Peribacteria bacterium RIFCSPLOWO2_12_FULL_53_10]HLC66527.1 hypothetical protein [Candidatus Nanoarchaeia archaeon]
MRSQDLEALRQGCAEYLGHMDVAQHSQMSIRDLLRAVLHPTPTTREQDFSRYFEAPRPGKDKPLADKPAGNILKILDRMIERARKVEQRIK